MRAARLYWADDPSLRIMLHVGCAHEQKVRGLQWVESIGMANKNAAFAKRFEAQWSQFFDNFDGFIVLTSISDA